ncbi:MAG: BamA/TamA family outer membrane protein, partial [Bdellovibrionota bacterium]
EKRLLRDNIVQGTYFTENCKNLETAIQQSFLLGPPRTLRFGVGIDTENGPLLQLSWRHHRFSRMAAQANLTIQTSLSEQSLVGRAEIFPWRSRPRLSVTPELRLVRKRTDDMVQITNTLQTLSTKTWDAASSKWTLSAGPAFVWERYQTAAASRYLQESSLALLANAEVRTHTFEIYDAHPQDGSLLGVSAEYRDRALGFPDRTWKVSGEGRFISALGECGKGHCVAAFRLSASNTWTSADSIDTLPPSLRTYLGGFESLRGFGLTKIPDNNGNGALSSVASGIELRGVDLFIARWEPYVFFDIGATGTKTSHLDAPNYYTSGLGLRWSSPIGMIQGYISRPSVGDFYAYASFGGEF